MSERGDKKTGIAHLVAATGYSLSGFRRLLGESAFRHEIGLAVVVLGALFAAGAKAGDLMISAILFLVLFAAEALNTAVEEIIDRISPERSETGKHAKDLGSFAVFCLLSACLGHAAFVLWRLYG